MNHFANRNRDFLPIRVRSVAVCGVGDPDDAHVDHDGNSAPLELPYEAETSFGFVLPTRASLHSRQGFGLVLDFASGLLHYS
jgi:hypothetical protein